MPRLNRDEYFTRRARLRDDWRDGGRLLRCLTTEQQWALHDFYLLAHDLSEKDVLARRNATVKSEPSLTKAAGFAYRSFVALRTQTRQHATAESLSHMEIRESVPARRRSGSSQVVARVRPDQTTDMKLLADAVILHAREMAARAKSEDERAD